MAMRNKPAFFLCLLLIGYNPFCAAQQKRLDSVLLKIMDVPAANHRLSTQASASRAYLVKLKPSVKKEALAHQGIVVRRTLDQGLLIIQVPADALSDALYEEKWPVN